MMIWGCSARCSTLQLSSYFSEIHANELAVLGVGIVENILSHGIIARLTRDCGGNVHDMNIVSCS